jgi:hypothetical protein
MNDEREMTLTEGVGAAPWLPPSEPGDGSAPPGRRRLVIGGAVVVVVAVVGLLVALATPGARPGRRPTALSSPGSTAAPGGTTSPTATPSTRPTTPEAALIARVPSSYRATCQALADADKRSDFKGVPAVACEPNGTLTVFLYQLPDPTLMNNEYRSIVQANGLATDTCDPGTNTKFRAASSYSTGSAPRGKALCYVGTDNQVRIEWTDDALNVYGSISAEDTADNRRLVYQFWTANGALLR